MVCLQKINLIWIMNIVTSNYTISQSKNYNSYLTIFILIFNIFTIDCNLIDKKYENSIFNVWVVIKKKYFVRYIYH